MAMPSECYLGASVNLLKKTWTSAEKYLVNETAKRSTNNSKSVHTTHIHIKRNNSLVDRIGNKPMFFADNRHTLEARSNTTLGITTLPNISMNQYAIARPSGHKNESPNEKRKNGKHITSKHNA